MSALTGLHLRRPRAACLALWCLLPAAIAAQDSAWSRLTYRPACPPTDSCPWRPGLLWDTTNVMPGYPEVMRQVGIGGSVELRVVVDTNGRVDPASIRIESSTNKAFELRTLDAVKTWQFGFSEAPDRPDGSIPLPVRISFAIQSGCTGSSRASHARAGGWSHPEFIVLACEARLVPRDQVRPMNGPG